MATVTEIGTLISHSPEIRGGRPRIAGTGVSVRRIAQWYNMGLIPEEITRIRPFISGAPLESGLIGKTDPEQLTFAGECGSVLYTFNVSDFHRLHTLWTAEGKEHAGIILARQRQFSIGEQLRRILLLRANRIEYLSNWG